MKKLELKDIASYLPYGMIFMNKKGVVLRMDSLHERIYNVWANQRYIKGRKDENDINYPYLSSLNCSGEGDYLRRIKPILRPMSDLVNPLEDGTIPIVELANIASIRWNTPFFDYRIVPTRSYDLYIASNYNGNEFLGFDLATKSFFSGHEGVPNSPANQVELFDYLNAHHFDYRGLIDEGLAVDINIINKDRAE